jgi:AGZA family xanthine/uracil permease-like MFS transporter
MYNAISAAHDVSESMLDKRFEFANALIALPPWLTPTFLKMDVAHALTPKMLPFVFVFLFMFTFDAIGTLIGVCEQAGFMRDNKLPRAKQAMISDAIATVAGAALGTSTVTSFVESAAGVEAGGRTGLTGLVVAALFLLALFSVR